MRISFLIGIALEALLVAPIALPAAELPKPIESLVDGGLKVERSFPAASGLTGWVLSRRGQYTIVFTTSDRKTLIVGPLYDENRRDLAVEYSKKYVPRPDLPALLAELEQAQHVPEGTMASPKSVIYVIFDPNCPYCHAAWKMLQPYEKAGLLVRWVPVAYLAPTSLPKAVEIMAAPDTTAAFRRMMQTFRESYTPSAASDPKTKPEIVQALEANLRLMEKLGMHGTPGIVWKDKDGKVRTKDGVPRLWELPAMTGLPEQKVDDPDLARFR